MLRLQQATKRVMPWACPVRLLGSQATSNPSHVGGKSSGGGTGSSAGGSSTGRAPPRAAITRQLALYSQLLAAARVQASVLAPPKPIPVLVDGKVMDVPGGVWAPSSVFKPQGSALVAGRGVRGGINQNQCCGRGWEGV